MDSLEGSRVLVTGGAGFVGSNLVARLLREGADSVHVVDNLLSSERSNLPVFPKLKFTQGSIADNAILFRLDNHYDYVFHLATYHGNQSSIHDPIADHDNNLITTLKLFERLKGFTGIRKVVYSGAGCAVAEKTFDQAHATDEDAPITLAMDSPYSISKIVGEFYAVYYHSRHQFPVVRARFQNVYGPGEVLGAGQWRGTPATVWRNVVPTFIYRSLQREALPLEGGGQATRDFIYVDDIVEGLLRCALHGGPGEVYNLASGVETSIADLARIIDALTGNPVPPVALGSRDWDHSGRRFGSTEKASLALGFQAKQSLADGLAATLQWTRAFMPLIQSCIAKHSDHLASAIKGLNEC